MIRFLHAYFPARTVFLGVSEALLATLAFVAAMFAWLGGLDTTIALHYEQGALKLALIVSLFVLSMYYFDLYDPMVLRNRREIVTRLIQALGTLCVGLALIYSAFPQARVNHRVFVTGMSLACLLVLLWRRLFLLVNSWPAFQENVLVLGDGKLARAILGELSSRPELGFNVVCHLTEEQDWSRKTASLPSEGYAQELERIVETQRIERIVVAMGDRRGKLPVETLLKLKTRGIRIQDGVELHEAITGKISLDSLRLSWLLFSPGFQVSRSFLFVKRVLSVGIAGVLLVLFAPLMLLVAAAVKLDSPGPVIFRQKRVGKNGKPFTLYKFRSMYQNADREGNHQPAKENDRRCTRVGRWLRATRVDELPQLFNIVLGDMYFVGPRPFVPNQEEELVAKIPYYSQRWTVRPGATGWAQVNRGYCATVEDNIEKLSYDLFYIKNMSVGLDLLILFKTAKTLLLARGGR